MSVRTQIDRLNAIKLRIRANLAAQGIAVPADTMLEEMAMMILSVAGEDGQDGISATHSWDGTTLTITSASGTSSANLKGDPGKDGYTPVKGKDYFTPADKADMIQQVLDSIGAPWFGYVTADKKIILTGGGLTEGTYTAAYVDEDGTEHEFGSITLADGPSYTNILDVYDIQYNKRFSPSSMGYKDGAGIIAFAIPWADVWGKTLRLKGFANLVSSGSSSSQVFAVSGSTYKGLAGVDGTNNMFTSSHVKLNNGVYELPINETTMSGATSSYDRMQIHLVLNSSGASVSAADLADRIITIDEEIPV